MGDAGQMASCWMPDVKGKERRRNLYYSDESSRIEPLNRSSRREEAPTSFSPNGMSLLTSAATRSTIPESRIGTMNPIVLVLVLVLVLETKLAGRGRVRERGRGRRDASWKGSGCGPRRVRLVRPSGVIFLRTKLIRRAFNS